MILYSFPAITLNISADLAGMGAVANMLIPKIHPSVFAIFFCGILLFNLIYLSYRKIANILQFLCLVLLCYFIVPFLSKQNWIEIIKNTFWPEIVFDKKFFALLVGILGTTISPYLFFWQTSVEVEEVKARRIFVNKQLIHEMKTDVRFGIFFSNIIFYFIILAAATELHANGITEVFTVDQAALALRPLAGDASYFLFAFGVIGTGLLAIPVLAGSLSYIISEAFGWKEGLNKKFHQAKGFYMVMSISMLLALAITLTGINPVKALIYTAILYGLTAPVLIGMIMHICNNKNIMGEYTNKKISNILGILTLVIMTAAGGILLWQTFM
jgi:Mn2+/Fe2+ NRAMP family transporter